MAIERTNVPTLLIRLTWEQAVETCLVQNFHRTTDRIRDDTQDALFSGRPFFFFEICQTWDGVLPLMRVWRPAAICMS